METITFHNDTELDPNAFSVMGMSVKEEGSFGRFGTGLKYAIAKTLSLGDSIEITTKGQRFYFDTKKMQFRGKDFEQITCNGKEMPYTTELGKHWEPWQAYRELLCNARDEGGGVSNGDGVKAETKITVKGSALSDVHSIKDTYFLREDESIIWQNDTLQIIERPSNKVFYQGICVGSIAPSRYTYNLLRGVTLSEDRLAMYSILIPGNIGEQVRKCDNKAIAEGVLGDHFGAEGTLEGQMEFSGSGEPSQEFLDVAKRYFKKSRLVPKGMRDFARHCQSEILENTEEFTEREETMLGKAKDFLLGAGYDLNRFEIVKIPSEGANLFGTGEGKRINLTKRAFESGMFDLCATLLEEFAHCDSGYEDFTRDFQDWIFRAVLTQAEARQGVYL
jgi:hypothetical protein